jgi:hypothetical protein
MVSLIMHEGEEIHTTYPTLMLEYSTNKFKAAIRHRKIQDFDANLNGDAALPQLV